MLREITKGARPIEGLDKSGLVLVAKSKMKGTFDFAVELFSEHIKKVKKENSGGWIKFAVIVGHRHQAPTEDVKRLWDEMMSIYGDDERSIIHIKMILGTICMMCFAQDKREWWVKLDPEKNLKKSLGEVPDAAVYFLKQY